MKRKHFIHSLSATALGLFALKGNALNAISSDSKSNKPKPNNNKTPYIIPEGSNAPHNELFWQEVAKNFIRPSDFINLENGYFSHQPQGTIAFHINAQTFINTQTSRFMRTQQESAIESARLAFANFQGLKPEELAFTRNTTESLNNVIMGFPWLINDEVIIGDQDYGSMVESFQQAAARWGIIIKVAKVPMLPESDSSIIQCYTSLITPQTKMLHITHMINLSGQLIPAEKIIVAAKMINPDIHIAIDAAHSVAHVQVLMGELANAGADSIAGSLHKWLCNPIGVGFLFLKSNWIPKIWPLMGDTGVPKTNIRRFEHQGTRPINSLQTLLPAINFHQRLSSTAKYNRLTYLKLLWIGNKKALEIFGKGLGIYNNTTYQNQMESVIDLQNVDGIALASPLFPIIRGGAIATISLNGFTPVELAKVLIEKYQIFTVGIDHPIIKGIRITPHLSSSITDCLALNKALFELATAKLSPTAPRH